MKVADTNQPVYSGINKVVSHDGDSEEIDLMQENNVALFPVIDSVVLRDLQAIMEEEYTEVLQHFLDDSLSIMNDIHHGFAEARPQVIDAIEAMNLASKEVGAKRIMSVTQQMSIFINKNNMPAAAALLDELNECFADVHKELRNITREESDGTGL